jgi:hypothetical protein
MVSLSGAEMSKMDLPRPPYDAVVVSDRLENINSKLRVVAMAVKGVAAEKHDEDAYAISNMILDLCGEIDIIAAEIHPPMGGDEMTALRLSVR